MSFRTTSARPGGNPNRSTLSCGCAGSGCFSRDGSVASGCRSTVGSAGRPFFGGRATEGPNPVGADSGRAEDCPVCRVVCGSSDGRLDFATVSLIAISGSGPLCVMPAWMRSRGPVAAGGRDARSFDPGQSSACSGLDDSDACQAARFIAAARRRRVKVVVRPAGSACGAGRVSRGRTSRPSVA
jgi:hypothetical protein